MSAKSIPRNSMTAKDILYWGQFVRLCDEINNGSKDSELEIYLVHESDAVRKYSLFRYNLLNKALKKEKKNGSKALQKNHSKKSVVGKIKKDGSRVLHSL